jgi:hypothetical protein
VGVNASTVCQLKYRFRDYRSILSVSWENWLSRKREYDSIVFNK